MSKVKTNSEMLVCIKQYNKKARETKAIKEGFASASAFISYLEKEIKGGRGNSWYSKPVAGKTPCPTTTKAPSAKKEKIVKEVVGGSKKPTIHIVDDLDSSGSMFGAKIDAATKGINIGVESLKKDTAKVNYTYTFCDFSDDIIFRHVLVPLCNVGEHRGATRGSTALFDSIGKTVEKIKPSVKKGDKVLFNIYTDGQENSSRHYTAEAINTLIQKLSGEGWVFTFIGTASDVAYAQSRLSIKSTNTLVYDGSAKGLEKSFTANAVARASFSASVERGEDVSEGFYKDIN